VLLLLRDAVPENKNFDQPPTGAATSEAMVTAARPDSQWSNVHPFPKERFSDSELVAAVAQGDHAALEIIWNRYASAVRSTLYSALGPDHSIEDLIQDVFISFFRCAGRLQNPSALKAYLLGSAIRIAAFERRTRGRRSKWLNIFKESGSDADERQLPDVGQSEVLSALRRVLDQVSERPRTAFILRYVEDLTVSEIAIAMGTSDATAKRDVARGRARVLLLASREPTLCDFLKYLGGNES
jgi:RNA polymerase sigma-70 factor (ECF subfamily)